MTLTVAVAGATGDASVPAVGGLTSRLAQTKSILWIGGHADDELFVGGALGLAVFGSGAHCTIVNLNTNSGFAEANRTVASFLGGADFVTLDGRCSCDSVDTAEAQAEVMTQAGVLDALVALLRDRRPEIVLSFSPENRKCPHAASALLRVTPSGHLESPALTTRF